MNSKLTLLLLLFAVFTSCKKTTNIDVELSTSGRLTYKLIDNNGKGLPDVKVSLFEHQNNYSNGTMLLDTRVTDSDGQVDFGDLNPNSYLLIADSANVNNVAYRVQEYVQVITGAVKKKETKVTDHSGIFRVIVKSYTNQALKNIGVMMIPYNRFDDSTPISSQLKVSDFSGVTNEHGSISFRIPSNRAYVVYLYNVVTNASYNYNANVYVEKDATIDYGMTIYW
jgi:5-hydroxyisourate hydrolase-like protein (transthyretin family)